MMVLNWNEDRTTSSSSDKSYDSDEVDSDIEAELYSIIYHPQKTYPLNSEEEKNLNSNNEKNSIACLENYNISIEKNFNSNNEKNSIACLENSNISIAKNLNSNNEKNSIACLENSNISINFNSDRVSDCDLYNNFDLQNDSVSNQKICQNFNSLKRKSDTCTDLLNDAQSSSSFDLQNIQCEESKIKKSKQNISNTCEISSDTNDTSKQDTSDSDSDIICIEPSDSKKKFQTNLSLQTVTLNSDSEDSMPPSFQHNCLFNGQNNQSASLLDFTESRSHEELWFLNDEDLSRFKRNSGRYHESASTFCSKCTERGHSARFCSYTKSVKCFLCGNKHFAPKCKKRTCSRCFEKGHDFRNCRQNVQTCTRCQMIGHLHEECPDVWRKYHLTTSKKFIPSQILDQNTPLYCYNCGLLGHFGAVCGERRSDRFSSITWPSVLDYDSPLNPSSQKLKLSFIERCTKQKRERILLKRKRRKMLKKAKREENKTSFSKEINFPRTPKKHLKGSPNCNLNNNADPNCSSQIVLSQKALRNKKYREQRRRKRLFNKNKNKSN